MIYDISNFSDLELLASKYASMVQKNQRIYLSGDLGAGKTAFAKLFMQSLGYLGRVTSPTYALLQDYQTTKGIVIHADLYRLADPEEIYEIGLFDYFEDESTIIMIEWPEKARQILPSPDYHFLFTMQGNKRSAKIADYSQS